VLLISHFSTYTSLRWEVRKICVVPCGCNECPPRTATSHHPAPIVAAVFCMRSELCHLLYHLITNTHSDRAACVCCCVWSTLYPGTHLIRGSVGPQVGLNAVEQTKVSFPCGESHSDPSDVHPIAQSLYRNVFLPESSQRFPFLVLSVS
jgi:hypothetical protein